ncbi:TraB/GumN family protein [Janthinobacterium sp.]|uniref:TraB/GumN family protein n=1 Tax=Janthinobacterium sp. TaxID=1871054 RepID=UPI00293D3B56|nr:TraB/GumN family protein [Janthinobacterium sp.]
MFQRLLPALCLSLSVSSAWAQADTPAVEAEAVAVAVAEKILVVGQRPGPGLWKVTKDDHVLWVFGTYSPLPEKMEWRSQQVEAILAQSQEYLTPPRTKASVGFFQGLSMLPSLFGLKKNPDGATLQDVLPADVYARWQPLKAKYLGDNDGIERERPIFAAETLFNAGLRYAGLSKDGEVSRKIDGIVKQHKLKVTKTDIQLTMDDPSKLLKDYKKSQLADGVCFAKTLARLESDIDAMRVRANAWAKGDLEGLQKLSYVDQESECRDAMRNADFVKSQPGFQNVKERAQAAWLASAEKALAVNASTFATLSLANILDPQGYLAMLKAKGYQVETPD